MCECENKKHWLDEPSGATLNEAEANQFISRIASSVIIFFWIAVASIVWQMVSSCSPQHPIPQTAEKVSE
jgi:hypothetical protein